MSEIQPKNVKRRVELREIGLHGEDVLIVGSGGKEHALSWKLCQSPNVGSIYGAPGNAGMSVIQTGISATDIDGIVKFVDVNKNIKLTVVLSDDPKSSELVNKLTARGRRVFGADAAANDFIWRHGLCAATDCYEIVCGEHCSRAVKSKYSDDEVQALLPLLQSDLYKIMNAAIDGTLDKIELKWSCKRSVSVTLKSDGKTGCIISGLNFVDNDVNVFFNSVAQCGGHLIASGERVLCVNAVADDFETAKKKAYDNIAKIELGIRNCQKGFYS